jgi:hypothetical protein
LKNELLYQVRSITQALVDTAVDLGEAARQWGGSLYEQLESAVDAIVNDIVRKGVVNMDGDGMAQWADIGRCRLLIEPGLSTYNSKTCVWCCNCQKNLDAVRFYLAWRLDCRARMAVEYTGK